MTVKHLTHAGPGLLATQVLHWQAEHLELFLRAPSQIVPLAGEGLRATVLRNHCCNCQLWREEDLARRTNASDAEIVANKRAIDRFNQSRNDAVERLDEQLIAHFPSPRSGARMHSETAGTMIDRLSILTLKVHHMALQVARVDATPQHRADCTQRLARLRLQQQDLADCLQALLDDCSRGDTRFAVYRQFKMYNDPAYRTSP